MSVLSYTSVVIPELFTRGGGVGGGISRFSFQCCSINHTQQTTFWNIFLPYNPKQSHLYNLRGQVYHNLRRQGTVQWLRKAWVVPSCIGTRKCPLWNHRNRERTAKHSHITASLCPWLDSKLCGRGVQLLTELSRRSFSYFFHKIGFDISCKLSSKETICMKCQILFW